MDVTTAIKRILKTGKIEYGSKKAIENTLNGTAKAIITAKNCPKETKQDILTYTKQAKIPLIEYKGTALDLGEICGKPFLVANITILNEGDVDISKITEEKP